ncbi:hypothetical protein Tco_0621942 [Tanacetum coccineum]
MEQTTSICVMVGQYMQKKEEDKRIAEEQAAKDRYWKILICYDDDEDDTIAVTPVLLTEEPVDSLIMEDEHLDTISEQRICTNVCDVHLCNNPTPLEAFKEHSKIVVDFNDDSTSSDDGSPVRPPKCGIYSGHGSRGYSATTSSNSNVNASQAIQTLIMTDGDVSPRWIHP